MNGPDPAPRWISEAEVVSMMDMREAIEALERGLLCEARGEAQNMVKTHVAWGKGSTLHAIGAAFSEAGLAGTKTWAHAGGGATPLLILFDGNSGALRAVIEAFALGQLRTGSASGVATRWLAAENADELAIIGTGKQGLAQVAAVAAVRPIRRVRAFGRDENRRAEFAARVEKELGIETRAAKSIDEAVRDARVITLVTRAKEPFLRSEMVSRGAHINAMGAIVPGAAEVAQDVLGRSSRIVVDSVPQAQRLSRELMDFFITRPEGWEQVQSLAGVAAARRQRNTQDDLTLFKSLGMGISDLSLGIELYKKALRLDLGRSFPHPQAAVPRMRSIHQRDTENTTEPRA